MKASGPTVSRVVGWLTLCVGLLLASGCETPPGPPRGGRGARPAQIPLEGKQILFGGAVEMRVTLAPFIMLAPDGGRPRGGAGGDFRSTGRPDGEFGPPPMGSRGGGAGGGRQMASGMAPSTHRVRVSFTNLLKERVQFDVYEVRSLLGVFGVRPNRIVLEPDQTTEIDPMRSSLEVNFETLDITVNVRRSGKTENVVVHLTPAAAP
jgi:hypothetical protein